MAYIMNESGGALMDVWQASEKADQSTCGSGVVTII